MLFCTQGFTSYLVDRQYLDLELPEMNILSLESVPLKAFNAHLKDSLEKKVEGMRFVCEDCVGVLMGECHRINEVIQRQ